MKHEIRAAVDPEVEVTLLLPWAKGETDLRCAVLAWLDAQRLSILAVAEARGLKMPAVAGTGAGSESRQSELSVLAALTDGYLATDPNGWEIAIVDGERRLTVGPGEPQDIEVSIVPPAGGGRASYALASRTIALEPSWGRGRA